MGQLWSLLVPRLHTTPEFLWEVSGSPQPLFSHCCTPGSRAVPGTWWPLGKSASAGDGHHGEGQQGLSGLQGPFCFSLRMAWGLGRGTREASAVCL